MEVIYYKIYWSEEGTPSFIGSTKKKLNEIINFHLSISEFFNEKNTETICSDYSLGIIKKRYMKFYYYMNKNKDSMKFNVLEKKIMFRDEILGEIKETIIKMINKDSSKEYRKIYQNEYRIKNKAKIYKARKIWVQKNKEIIRCGCGGKYDNHLNEKKRDILIVKNI